MPISFPLNPTIGQVYTYSGRSWTWDGRGWFPGVAIGATGATGIQANLTAVTSNIIPAANVTYDLGTSALRWRDLYLSGNSINLGGAVITASNNSVVLPEGSQIGNVTIGSGGATITVSDTRPSTGTNGQLWFDSDLGDLNIFVSNSWAIISGAQGPAGPPGATGAVGATGAGTVGVGASFGVTGISYANSANASPTSTVTITGNGFVTGANVFVASQFVVDGNTYIMSNVAIPSNSAITFSMPPVPATNILYDGSRYSVTVINGDGQLAYRPNLLLTSVEYAGPTQLEYLVVAGGGGGGQGGGGAGGMVVGNVTLQSSPGINYTVTVGGGGARYTGLGSNSSLAVTGLTVTGIGGGGGGNANSNGTNGGSGGGSGGNAGAFQSGGTATQTSPAGGTGYGFNGSGNPSTSFGSAWGDIPSGAGGGAGGAASNNTNGPGRANSITGSSVTYAVGGNGSTYYAADAANAAANTGNGGNGGGASNGGDGGIGGSGIVIIAYSNVYANITTVGAGLTYTFSSSRPGYKVYTFTQGTGTITW
jgi:hypothetical protein